MPEALSEGLYVRGGRVSVSAQGSGFRFKGFWVDGSGLKVQGLRGNSCVRSFRDWGSGLGLLFI